MIDQRPDLQPARLPAPSVLYVECDIPEGMTLREWRHGHTTPHTGLQAWFRAWRRSHGA